MKPGEMILPLQSIICVPVGAVKSFANFGNFIANNEKLSALVRDDNVLSIMQKDVTTFQEYRMSCHTCLRGAWT